jgi:hypothetical protein
VISCKLLDPPPQIKGCFREVISALTLPSNTISIYFLYLLSLTVCITLHFGTERSRVSSVSIVSDYGLDDRAIVVRSPAGAKDFSSSLCVQTGSGAHSASCAMGTGGPFPGGVKARSGHDADHSPPSSAEVENE